MLQGTFTVYLIGDSEKDIRAAAIQVQKVVLDEQSHLQSGDVEIDIDELDVEEFDEDE